MSSVTGPTTETATPREPILICYDDSPDAVRAIEPAAALLGPRRAVVVDELDAAVIVIGSRGLTVMKRSSTPASRSRSPSTPAGRS